MSEYETDTLITFKDYKYSTDHKKSAQEQDLMCFTYLTGKKNTFLSEL